MDPTGGQIMPYRDAIEQLATKWHQAGHPVPSDYTNEDARPSSPRARVYQKRRGAGDGRRPAVTVPITALLSARGAGAETRSARGASDEMEGDGSLPQQLLLAETRGEGDEVRVVPVRRTDHAIEALLPINPDHILVLADPRANSVAHEVTDAVRALFYQDMASPPVACRVAGNEEGTVWAAAVQQGKRQAYPVNSRRKGSTGWIKGLAWFTLTALVTLGRQTPIAQMAICATKQLPIYELPWLKRMPRQEYTTRGCENFRPESALDLLDLAAQREVKEWIAKAKLDLACLEEHGPACDRKDKPPLTVIGQEQFVRCALGYVWDCRQEGRCTLLDHQAPIDTQFNLPRLTRLFEGYPDQRLLEGILLEADVELQLVLHPNLVSVGNGYDSVQATIRELAGQAKASKTCIAFCRSPPPMS
ncbi:MAG: hypothetical protein SGPRY_005291 [Prymnesium sp.]